MRKIGSILLMIVMLILAGGLMLMIMLITSLAAFAGRRSGVQQGATADLLPAYETSSSPSWLGSSS